MENTATYLITCPHCGTVKRVAFSKKHWNETDAVLWSDGRIESSEWCAPMWTQQCPACKHFFIFSPLTPREVEDTLCEDTGELPYQTLKQAIVWLYGDYTKVAIARLDTWQAYNKLYAEVPDDEIPEEEKSFNRSNMQWLVEYLLKKTPWSYTFIFELLRQLGRKEEYLRLLDQLTYDEYVKRNELLNDYLGKNIIEDDEEMYCGFIEEKKEALKKTPRAYPR